MQKITQEQLNSIDESHGKWLRGEKGGQIAYLNGADLNGADLNGANLDGANLDGASLDGASLVRASLDGANLARASLDGANLDGANLDGASLAGASLVGAKTNKRYIQVACIGSRKGSTTYCFDDDLVLCGCWNNYKGGTLDEFEDRVKKEHANNPQYLAEYLGFIAYIRSLKEVQL